MRARDFLWDAEEGQGGATGGWTGKLCLVFVAFFSCVLLLSEGAAEEQQRCAGRHRGPGSIPNVLVLCHSGFLASRMMPDYSEKRFEVMADCRGCWSLVLKDFLKSNEK